jgi:Family of unknown function (DUF6245)
VDEPRETPATAEQLAAALAALGTYDGANTEAEHAQEAARLGGPRAYRLRLANALLGAAQTEALLADTAATDLDDATRRAAWEQQLVTAGAADDQVKRIGLIQWQVLRAATPLREIAQRQETGPIPLAAAHAADGLQALLGVIAASQTAVAAGDTATLTAQTPKLREARTALEAAIANTTLLLDLLASVGL